MDGLSAAASIVALLQATGAILKGIDDLRARLHPQQDLDSLRNTVTNLQATLIDVRECHDTIKASTARPNQEGCDSLPEAIMYSQRQIDRLADFAKANLLRKHAQIAHLGLTERNRRRVVEIRDSISEAQHRLQIILQTTNLRKTHELWCAVQQASILNERYQAATSATLEQIVTQIIALRDSTQNSTRANASMEESNQAVNFAADTGPTYGAKDPHSQMRITISKSYKRCDWKCNCQCHVRTEVRSPQWLSWLVGALFYHSTHTPAPNIRSCNSKTCLRSDPSSSVYLTYYLPAWWLRSTFVHCTWSRLQGKNSSWTVRIPRQFCPYDLRWEYVRQGSVGKVQELLSSREMSPYDVDDRGLSALHIAVLNYQEDMCVLLMKAGADWTLADIRGRSAADIVFMQMLTYHEPDLSVNRFPYARYVMDEVDAPDLKQNILHRIVTGACSGDLETELESRPSEANIKDWLGMSPLMWAARLGNHQYLEILLSGKVDTELADDWGSRALHHAFWSGSYHCVRSLLRYGADPRATNAYGETPLSYLAAHFIADDDISDLVKPLISHGADVEARDWRGYTPLAHAVIYRSPSLIQTLVECNADVNKEMGPGIMPITLAIHMNHTEGVKILCMHGAKPAWGTEHILENVLGCAALYGTVDTIKALANADFEPFSCDAEMLLYHFQSSRDVYFRNGDRQTRDEEFAAFKNLLDKKALPIDVGEAMEDLHHAHYADQNTLREEKVEDFEGLPGRFIE